MDDEPLGPGSEFYYERLNRARAIPEAQRSPDVAVWLSSHAAVEAAAAALPLAPADATLIQPLGGDAALVSVLQLLVHFYTIVPAELAHPQISRSRLVPQLPPLMAVSCQDSIASLIPQPQLRSLLQRGMAGEALDLEDVARLLLLASEAKDLESSMQHLSLVALEALEPALCEAPAAAHLAQQLAQLQREQQQLASGSGSGSEVPSVQQLQAVRHMIALALVDLRLHKSQLPGGEAACLMQLAEGAAKALRALRPDDARSSLACAKAAMSLRLAPQSSVALALPVKVAAELCCFNLHAGSGCPCKGALVRLS